MKLSSLFFAASALLCAGVLVVAGCKKNSLYATQSEQVAGNAQLKIINASLYQRNPGYQISINGNRVSSLLSSTRLTDGTFAPTPFPGGGLNTGGSSTNDYLSVAAGPVTCTIGIPATGTATDSVRLASAAVSLEAGKKYSLFFADTAANAAFVLVADTLAQPDSGYAKYQFVNLLPDQPSLDLYVGAEKKVSALPYKGVSAPFILPTNNASSTWAIRTAGGSTNLITYASASTLGNQRVFNIFARGYNGVTTPATDPRRRGISLVYTR